MVLSAVLSGCLLDCGLLRLDAAHNSATARWQGRQGLSGRLALLRTTGLSGAAPRLTAPATALQLNAALHSTAG